MTADCNDRRRLGAEFLRSQDWRARRDGLEILATCGDIDAVRRVASEDPSARVRRAASALLGDKPQRPRPRPARKPTDADLEHLKRIRAMKLERIPPKLLTVDGVSMTIRAWSQQPGAAPYRIIRCRHDRGWPDREAVFGSNPPPPRRLTEPMVRELRARLAAGERRALLAHQYGVAVRTLSDVARGITWKG